jgi:hypothetical protein
LNLSPQRRTFLCVSCCEWGDFYLDVDIRGLDGVDKLVRFRRGADGTAYAVNLRANPLGDVRLDKVTDPDGPTTLLQGVPFPHDNGTWCHLRIHAHGARIQVWIDDTQYIDFTDPTPYLFGRLCLEGYTGGWGSCDAEWDNVMVTLDGVTGIGDVDLLPSTWGRIKNGR